ncbi:MAG: dicarboxylate/amino acid:cation symporter [Candidatus Thiodiazotropha sp. (ex Monitilora ramsayi)]|nr:dicarboxylate/amino acid:cation symporter [Candidatus Thiodiazotropha sp. (ex Monitilora ramsayi)]
MEAERSDYQSIAVLIRSHLWIQILIAMVLGIAIGLSLSPSGGALVAEERAYQIASWLRLPGVVFLNLIQMVVIPLITCSIILGIASSGDPVFLKRVGLRIFPYFVATTTIAVTIGIVLALTIEPGNYVDSQLLQAVSPQSEGSGVPGDEAVATLTDSNLPDMIAGLIPTNIAESRLTRDMLAIVIYAIIMGVALVSLERTVKVDAVFAVLETVQDISLKVVGWAMLLAPYAVFGLLADITIKVGLDAITGISVYMGTVILGLLLLLLAYLLIVTLLAKRNPIEFLKKIREVQLLAFSTSSSAAVMPLSMKTAEEQLAVKPAISKFVVPLGATVNMDGTALYQVVAAVFLTQVYGVDLSVAEIIMLAVTTVGASIGSPSTPGVGIVILATILQGIGVPPSGIALIIGVDRLLDMSRTAINVSGDLTACTVMNRWLGAKIN